MHNIAFSLRALTSGQCVLQPSDIQLLAPILAPEKVLCVGMNYQDHCLEQNVPIPEEPIIFNKFANAITGPYDNIVLPAESQVRPALGVTHVGQHNRDKSRDKSINKMTRTSTRAIK